MLLTDPQYFEVFWTEPGHAGADGVLDEEIVQFESTVSGVVSSRDLKFSGSDGFVQQMLALMVDPEAQLGIRLDGPTSETLTGAKVTVTSGPAAGRSWYAFLVVDGVLVPAGEGSFFDPRLVGGINRGDKITVDNREFLAYCYSDRHYGRDPLSGAQFMVSGVPIYPQRAAAALPLTWSGNFEGKMILQQHLMDRPCWPPVAIRYQRAVQEQLGPAADDRFRIWWTEHAQHGPAPKDTAAACRSIDYSGLISQGLRDVMLWAEDGVAPAPSMSYEYVDGQVVLPASVKDRGGIQPVVTATANGSNSSTIRVGESVRVEFSAEVPPRTGSITRASWDLDGSGRFATPVEGIEGTEQFTSAETEVAFDEPGTHYLSVRVAAHREGDVSSKTELIENVARVRIDVS